MRILLIDDEFLVLDVIAQSLRAEGHTVVVAGDGDEGLERFQKDSFDCVITDQSMPHLTGDEVAQAVKKSNPKMPVILLTGFGDMLDDKSDRPAGVDMIVNKLVTADELRHAIDRVMGKV